MSAANSFGSHAQVATNNSFGTATSSVHRSQHDLHDAKKTSNKAFRNIARTAMYGAIARILIGILKVLLKKKFSPALFSALLDETLSLNPLKWAVVVGGFSAFRGIQQALLRVPHVPEQWTSFIAGAIAGLPVLVMNARTRTEMALYLGVRAMQQIFMVYILPRSPRPIQQFKHFDLVALSLTCVEIMYSTVYAPNTHSAQYIKFLEGCSLLDRRVLCAIGGFLRNQILPQTVDYCMEKGIPIPTSGDVRGMCQVVHPGMTCNQNTVAYVKRHLLTISLPLYVPIKCGVTILFSGKKLVKKPTEVIFKTLKGIISSSLFLTLYITAPYRTACILASNGCTNIGLAAIMVSVFSIFPALFEPRSRRQDLALYCVMQASRSFILLMEQNYARFVPNRHHILAFYLFSTAMLLHQYDRNSTTLHPHLRKAFGWLLTEGHHTPNHRAHGPRHHGQVQKAADPKALRDV